MQSRLTAATVTGLLVLALGAGPSFAAEPTGDSVGPDDTSASWIGAWYGEAVTPEPGPCDPSGASSTDPCDLFDLRVEVETAFWTPHDGAVSVGIVWERAADDFDLYVFDAEGNDVAASTDDVGTAERIRIDEPVGTYRIGVVPVEVANGGYLGWASLSVEEVAVPEASGGSGSGGGGDGGGGATTQVSGSGTGTVTGAPTGQGTAFSFADAPYGSRAFDSRAASAGPTDGSGTEVPVAATPPVTGSPYPSAITPSLAPPAPIDATARVATSSPRPPGTAWIVLALGILAFALTSLAVFERFPDERRPHRSPRPVDRTGTGPAAPTA